MPLSGIDTVELLSIKTNKVHIEIKGRFKNILRKKSHSSKNNEFTLIENKSKILEYKLYDEDSPLFYENTTYNIALMPVKKKDILSIEHDYPGMVTGISETNLPDGSMILTGSINFRNNIGLSDFRIMVNGRCHGIITLNIFPEKIDYEDDYIALMDEVNEEIYNLSFDFLRQTYLSMGLRDTRSQSSSEFITILRVMINDIEKSLKRIVEKPHHKVEKETFYRKNKIKGKDIDEKWLRRHSNNISKYKGKIIISKTRTIEKQTSYDTYENQYLKFMLKGILRNIDFFLEEYNKLYRMKSQAVCREIEGFRISLKKNITGTFLNRVSDFHMRESNSLVFIMAEGYREFYKCSQILRKGLKIQSDIFILSQKDIAILYEYWCFIKINKILRNHYSLVSTNNIGIDNKGIFFTLKKGTNSKVKYLNPNTGEIFFVSYNNKFNQVTTNQKPDNTLIIEKVNPNIKYHFVFDAKYKIDYADKDTDYFKKYHSPGPKEDDINTMHRYRDSIMYETGGSEYSKMLFGAFILFPYSNEEEYKDHKFYKSIDKVNIGGFPFLPSAYSLMERYLINLIDESSISSFGKSIFNVGSKEFYKEVDFTKRNVIVGIVKNEKQLQANLKHKFYHIPQAKANLTDKNIEYVAISYSKKSSIKDSSSIDPGIKYYARIKNRKVLKRSEITELPKDSDELYIKFCIEEWKELPSVIIPEGGNVIVSSYTSEYLLKNARIIKELFIKTSEEFILWNELKRLNDKYVVELKDIQNEIKDTGIDGFKLKNIHLTFDDGKWILSKDNMVLKTYSRDRIKKSPINLIREIIEIDESQ